MYSCEASGRPDYKYVVNFFFLHRPEDGRTAPGVCGNGSVPLSHSGNVVTRIGIHTHILHRPDLLRVWLYTPVRKLISVKFVGKGLCI